MVDRSFDDLSRIYKLFSRIVGLLPFEGRGFDFIGTWFFTIYMLLNTFVELGMIVGYDIGALIKGRPLKADNIYISILAVSLVCRYYILLGSRETNATLFEKCAQLWQFCDSKGRETVKRYESKVRLVYGIYAGSSLMTNIIVPINAYVTRLPPLEPNGTEQRVLSYSFFVDDEPYKYLGYHPTFIIQSVVIQSLSVLGLVCDATVSGFAMLAAGYFRHLADRLTELSRLQPADSDDIEGCIKFHQRLLEYCYVLKEFSKGILLVQIISACYSISLVMLKIVSSDPDKYSHAPIMGICMCQLFIVQWTPDRLADQSQGVAFAAYSVLMTRLTDKRLCRDLRIMLVRAQVPVQIMAGGIVKLSLEKYASMMNGAFSFFMVLRTLDI